MLRTRQAPGLFALRVAMLSTSPESQFAHRVNRDGTIDSICRDCFATVATVEREADLANAEKDHVCSPWTRQRLRPRDPYDSQS